MQLLSLNSFPCTVLLPLAKRPFLYMTREQLDRIVSYMYMVLLNHVMCCVYVAVKYYVNEGPPFNEY